MNKTAVRLITVNVTLYLLFIGSVLSAVAELRSAELLLSSLLAIGFVSWLGKRNAERFHLGVTSPKSSLIAGWLFGFLILVVGRIEDLFALRQIDTSTSAGISATAGLIAEVFFTGFFQGLLWTAIALVLHFINHWIYKKSAAA